MYHTSNLGKTSVLLKFFAMFIILCATCFFRSAFTLSHKNLESEVENYLNSTKTLQANFVQKTASANFYGTLYIKKPGKIRIEYSNPEKYVIVMRKNRTTYYNYDLKEYANFANKSNFLSILSKESFSFAEFDEYHVEEEGNIISASIKLSEQEGAALHVIIGFNRVGDSLKFDSLYVNDGISAESIVKLSDIAINQPIEESKLRMRNPNFFKK